MAAEPQSPDRLLAQICVLANSRTWPVPIGRLRVTISGATHGHSLDVFVEGEFGNGYDYRVNSFWSPEHKADYIAVNRETGGLARPVVEFPEADLRDARKGLTKIMSVVMANATARYKELLRKIAVEKATKVRTPPAPPMNGHKAPYAHRDRHNF